MKTTRKDEVVNRGDFVRLSDGTMAIIKSQNEETGMFSCYASFSCGVVFWGGEECYPPTRLATSEERKELLSLLNKKGFKWDPKKMIIKERFLNRIFGKKNLLGEVLKIR